jgi:hypothetical protein
MISIEANDIAVVAANIIGLLGLESESSSIPTFDVVVVVDVVVVTSWELTAGR